MSRRTIPGPNMASSKGPAGAVFVARHGERVDYQWARDGKNWAVCVPTPPTPQTIEHTCSTIFAVLLRCGSEYLGVHSNSQLH